MNILVLNSGSSSLKFQLIDWPERLPVLRGSIERIGEARGNLRYTEAGAEQSHSRDLPVRDHQAALKMLSELIENHCGGRRIDAIGHRMVHGGELYSKPTRVNLEVLGNLRALAVLAPLHNPANVLGVEACLELYPELPQVVVFDTGFHSTLPEYAFRYALPDELYREHAIRRYGFHGTSHACVARESANFLAIAPSEINVISLHLGNGASACAIRAGVSVDVSHGFTPLEGLVMGTRSGDIDPAIPFYLARELRMSWSEIEQLLNRESGLRGICGTNDMRDIEQRRATGDHAAQLAFDLFCYRIKKYIGAYSAILGKLHVLAFTGGIGENSAAVRESVCSGLEHLGVRLHSERNRSQATAGVHAIHDPACRCAVLVISANEEYEIARESVELLRHIES